MSSVDLQGLASVLAHTYADDAQVRAQAEGQLAAFENVQGGHALFLQLLALPDSAIPFTVKQSAALRLKNLYRGYWSVRGGDGCRISELDRALVRERILDCIIAQTQPRLRVQLLEVIYFCWPTENPSEWPQLIPAIVHNLQSAMQSNPPDLLRMYGAACALRMVMKRYQFRAAETRAPLWGIVDATFPLLLPILQTLASLGAQATEETRELCRIVIKCVFLASTLALPPQWIADFGRCVPWFDCMLFLLESPVPGLESQPTAQSNPLHAEECVRVSPGWRVKKWVAQIFLRLYNRWGRPKQVGGDAKMPKAERLARRRWAEQFEAQYTTRVLGVLMAFLKAKSQGQYVSERVLHQSLVYVTTCVGTAEHYKLLKPHLPFLVQDVVLRQLCLTPGDLSLWQEDPHEFIRRSLDLMAEFMDARMAATGLLNDLLAFRTRDCLQLIISTIEGVFDTFERAAPADKNYILKEGAMRMFGSIKKLMMSKAEFRGGIETTLIRHVLPEFQSPHPFLRARACWLVRRYYKLNWTNQQAHEQAVRACVGALRDPELPVKMESWSAVSYIIEQEKVFDFIKPSLPAIIEAFHVLFDEIGNDAVINVLQTLVEKFGDDVAPFAVQLIGKLTDKFMSLIRAAVEGNAADDDDEEDEAGATCYSIVRTIVAVLYAIDTKPDLFTQAMPACCAILDVAFNERGIEMLEDQLEMISILIYEPKNAPIPDCMWKYVPLITSAFFNYAGDFLSFMLPVFDTVISKGGALLITPQGQPMLQQIFKIAQHILEDQERLIDSRQACVLIESIMANLRGQVDILVAPVVALSSQRLLTIIDMEEAREAKRKQEAAAAAAKRKKGKGVVKKGKGGRKVLDMTAEQAEDEEDDASIKDLKLALLDNIGVAAHYNPLLFCQFMASQPAASANRLFNVWLSHVNSMRNDFDAAKNSVLGLSSLLLLPMGALPHAWANGMPGLLREVMQILGEMSKLLAADHGDDEPVDLGDEDGLFHDIPEDEDVNPEVNQDADSGASDVDVDAAADAGDEDAPEDFLDHMEDAMLGNDGEGGRFASPLDDIDPFVFFAQSLETMSKQEPGFYQQWIANIGGAGQAMLQQHIEQAKRHAAEDAQEKAEEAQKAAQGKQ